MKIFVLCLLFFALFPTYALAQTSPFLNASPSLIKLDLKTDEPEAEITYTNESNAPIELTLMAKDFNGLSEKGTVNILEDTDNSTYKYGLSSWIHFETQSFSLNPHETKSVRIHIDKEKLPLGGHYASLMAQFEQKTTGNTISLRGVLATLLFVRAGKGFEREEAIIPFLGSSDPVIYFPSQYFFRLQNTGNVDLTPYGTLKIIDMFGRTVVSTVVNEGSLITLPESIRRYDLALTPKTFLFPSMYHAILAIHLGSNQKIISRDTVFFSQGNIDFLKLLIGIGGGLIIYKIYRAWRKPIRTNEA